MKVMEIAINIQSSKYVMRIKMAAYTINRPLYILYLAISNVSRIPPPLPSHPPEVAPYCHLEQELSAGAHVKTRRDVVSVEMYVHYCTVFNAAVKLPTTLHSVYICAIYTYIVTYTLTGCLWSGFRLKEYVSPLPSPPLPPLPPLISPHRFVHLVFNVPC